MIVLGHSEGTLIGTAVCARGHVAELILLYGGGGMMGPMLTFQRSLLANELTNKKGFEGWIARKFNIDKK
ncbi:hypothetical protein [Salirhabdus salicampi]|uniref:hypothetical protein n=1 Tax=Salirhabdus salicampi TaxID=476102 RepID=UPI0020C52F14|nr:hypothetical protein [Salirhabdus salicampi]MCP8615719.1 hypothetical protein [Salirhabdus salicampi]